MMTFWVFDFSETYICYRGCSNLNCYIGKKVQKNFLMGLKMPCDEGVANGITPEEAEEVVKILFAEGQLD